MQLEGYPQSQCQHVSSTAAKLTEVSKTMFRDCILSLGNSKKIFVFHLPLSHSTQKCLLHQPAQSSPVSAHLLKRTRHQALLSQKQTQGQLVTAICWHILPWLKSTTTRAALRLEFTGGSKLGFTQVGRATRVGTE